MSRREEYEQQTETLLEPIVTELGFELVDVEYVKEGGTWYLRAYIDKPGGIAVDDCEAVSRRFSDILDEKDYIADSYVFELAKEKWAKVYKTTGVPCSCWMCRGEEYDRREYKKEMLRIIEESLD